LSLTLKRLLPYIALGVVYIVWGSTYLAIRIVVGELPPFAAAALRFSAAGLVMGAFAFWRHRQKITLGQVADYAFIGILLLSVSNALVMWSETRIPSGIAALLVAAIPLWMTLLDGFRAGGERWTPRIGVGVACGLLGVGLVVRPEGDLQASWPGVLALQVACLSWSYASLRARDVPRKLPVLQAAAVEMVAASVVLLGESRLFGEDLGAFSRASGGALLALGYLAVFGSLVGFTAFSYCLNELPASTVGTYAYVNPIVAVLLGSLVLHEPVSPSLVSGAALILLAVVISTRRPASRRSVPKTEATFGAEPRAAAGGD
jgi:drug/metabolite transporter (DMT)-like permease